MAETTGISWCDSTFNPWEGCQKISPGCDHCYAEARNGRFGGGVAPNWGPHAPRRRTSDANWQGPLRWQQQAAAFEAEHGRRRRVFCASLGDVFDAEVNVLWRLDLFDLIARTPALDWLLLTKRVGNVRGMVPLPWLAPGGWPANVWLGATVVNQAEAERDVPKLLQLPAPVRFLSCEPLLGPIDLSFLIFGVPTGRFRSRGGKRQLELQRPPDGGLQWVIAGGESGGKARPMHPDWPRRLRDQCTAFGVPFLFKQWGEWISADQDQCRTGPPLSRWQWADGQAFAAGDGQRSQALFCKAGKTATGNVLDGVECKAWPVLHAVSA